MLTSLSSASSTSPVAMTSISSLLAACTCPNNDSSSSSSSKTIEDLNAEKMTNVIQNKTGFFEKIHHRATHSVDAFWATSVVSGILVSIILGVLWSQMWKEKNFITSHESQPVRYEHYNPKSEMLVKDMLKSRARSLMGFFKIRSKGEYRPNSIQMEAFLDRRDVVDSSIYQDILCSSSSSSSDGFDLSDEDDDISFDDDNYVFSMDPQTGEWTGDETRGDSPKVNTKMGGWGFLSKIRDFFTRPRRPRHRRTSENVSLLSYDSSDSEEELRSKLL